MDKKLVRQYYHPHPEVHNDISDCLWTQLILASTVLHNTLGKKKKNCRKVQTRIAHFPHLYI